MVAKIKKILGILLAVCFLISVTAAAVSAQDNNKRFEPKDNNKGFEPKDNDRFKPRDDDRFKPRDNDRFKPRGHWIPGHWETKLVKTFIGFEHGKPVYIYKLVKVFVPAKWVF